MDYFKDLGESEPQFKEATTLYRTMEGRVLKQKLASTPTESFLK